MAKIVLILALFAAVFCIGNTENQDICSLPLETGPCRAAMTRYGFNSTSQQCEVFLYGGCKGNANNFETLEDCEAACPCKQ